MQLQMPWGYKVMRKLKFEKGYYVSVIALLFTAFFITGCSRTEIVSGTDISNFTAQTRNTTAAFGTVSVLRLYGDFSIQENVDLFNATWQQVLRILEELNSLFSLTVEDSEIVRFNNLHYGETMEISHHMARVVELAKKLHDATDGLFDPTIHPIVDLWGFTPRFNVARFQPQYPFDRDQRHTLPDSQYIQAFLNLVNFDGILLQEDEYGNFTLTKNIPPVEVNGVIYQAKLDFGAILKGYATDLVGQLLREQGFEFGHFSAGGSSMYILNGMDIKEGGEYKLQLGLRRPREGQTLASSFIRVAVSNTALSTSGDYSHMFFVDGVRYCHIFNTTTGWPVNTPATAGDQSGIAKISVFGEGGAFAEGLSTALMALQPNDALQIIDSLGYKAILVYYTQGQDYFNVYTNVPLHLIEVLDPAFVLLD